jgi:hypothetical protein
LPNRVFIVDDAVVNSFLEAGAFWILKDQVREEEIGFF